MVLEFCDEDGWFSSNSWMHMNPVGFGKDVLVCSSQCSGIDVVHVSSMKFEPYLSSTQRMRQYFQDNSQFIGCESRAMIGV